jgi:hypothetical protein
LFSRNLLGLGSFGVTVSFRLGSTFCGFSLSCLDFGSGLGLLRFTFFDLTSFLFGAF